MKKIDNFFPKLKDYCSENNHFTVTSVHNDEFCVNDKTKTLFEGFGSVEVIELFIT